MADKILILCGPRATYGFTPVPPLTNSAPEKNVYRIAEGSYGSEINVHVISVCTPNQKKVLRRITSDSRYHHIMMPYIIYDFLQSKLFNNCLVNGVIKKLTQAYDLFSLIYLLNVIRIIKKIDPQIIIINDLTQYIRFVHLRLSGIKLGLFLRSEVGESRRYFPELDFIIINSKGFETYAHQLLTGQTVRTYVLPNSLEESFCSHKKPRKEVKNEPVIIYCGRIVPVKGVFELIQAFEQVSREMTDVKLLIVGGGYGQGKLNPYELKILNYVQENNLRVDFIGRVPHEDLPKYYSMADLAVFPSIWWESFGMVALEAMRCGLPVIASLRPGFEELIVDGETGILIDDPENVDVLSRLIKDLLTKPEKMAEIGIEAYKHSLQYTPEITNMRFKKIIESELESL